MQVLDQIPGKCEHPQETECRSYMGDNKIETLKVLIIPTAKKPAWVKIFNS